MPNGNTTLCGPERNDNEKVYLIHTGDAKW